MTVKGLGLGPWGAGHGDRDDVKGAGLHTALRLLV